MDLNRSFQYTHDGRTIQFTATYNLQLHNFSIVEDGCSPYTLSYHPTTKSWTTSSGSEPSIPIATLADLVQRNFGVFV
ncbi:hypothetical protein ACFSBF_08930 [Sphingobacterium suaedae]